MRDTILRNKQSQSSLLGREMTKTKNEKKVNFSRKKKICKRGGCGERLKHGKCQRQRLFLRMGLIGLIGLMGEKERQRGEALPVGGKGD